MSSVLISVSALFPVSTNSMLSLLHVSLLRSYHHLSVLCLHALLTRLWSDKSQIIWLTMQNTPGCRNPPIPSQAQIANYLEGLALASLPWWWERESGCRGRWRERKGQRKGKRERARETNNGHQLEELESICLTGKSRFGPPVAEQWSGGRRGFLKLTDDLTKGSSSLLRQDGDHFYVRL